MVKNQTWDEMLASRYQEPASSVYCIAFTPRSGSTWLGQILQSTGSFGTPSEYFNQDAANYIIGHSACPDFSSYYAYLKKVRQTSGLFGYEIAHQHLAKLLQEGHDEIVGDVDTWFYLRRRDYVAQAVSLYRASHSNIFHSYQLKRPIPKTPFDAQKIEQAALGLMAAEYHWRSFFQEWEIQPIELWYEDLVNFARVEIIEIFRDSLNVPADTIVDTENSTNDLQQISDDHSRYLREEFRSKEPQFIEFWDKHRGEKTVADYKRIRL